MRDVVVAGGGPVGLAAAVLAARAGLDVVVREPRVGTVDKACGEGLMPGAVAALAALGVHPAGHRLAGIRYVDGRCSATAAFGAGPGLGVRRTALHDALRKAADAAGVEVQHRSVREVRQDERWVVVDGEPARYLVGADGLHSSVRRLAGLDAGPGRLRRFGLRVHAATAPWSSYVEVHWAPGAEAYVTPVADDLVGVAVLTAHPAPMPELLRRFPAIVGRIGDDLSRPMGAGPLRQQTRGRVAGRVLLVGDAAGYVDALTGEGIAGGLTQARAAVDAVLRDDPASYEQAWRSITRQHDRLTRGLLTVTRSRTLRRHLVPTAARMPRVFTGIVDRLASPSDPG